MITPPPFPAPATVAPCAPRTIRVTLDIPEADLAHRWADITWEGRNPMEIGAIIKADLHEKASIHRHLMGQIAGTRSALVLTEERILDGFRAHHPNLVTVF